MKVVILAGGKGTRLSEETVNIPKPMVEIGSKPILWHIMKIYSHYGFNEFIICCGYKGYLIKEYFANYFLHQSDVTFDLSTGVYKIHSNNSENWKVTLVDTGLETKTARRIKMVEQYTGDKPFMLTYGDGLSNVDINKLLEFHHSHTGIVTLTASQPVGRFGTIRINQDNQVIDFKEKPRKSWINSGFMVCDSNIFGHLLDDVMLEDKPFKNISALGLMAAYKHDGWFSPMDTLRDMHELNDLWNGGKAPWKVWT
jgi:glucose-1-phosphate cytidylyltransferase